MKYIIEHFNSKKILDMSSGWGDRLVGAMACNIDCYHGFDPNSCLHPGYKKMIEFFKDQKLHQYFRLYQNIHNRFFSIVSDS